MTMRHVPPVCGCCDAEATHTCDDGPETDARYEWFYCAKHAVPGCCRPIRGGRETMWSEGNQYKALVEFTGANGGRRMMIDFHSISALEEFSGGVIIHTRWNAHEVSQTMDEVLERVTKVTGVRMVQ